MDTSNIPSARPYNERGLWRMTTKGDFATLRHPAASIRLAPAPATPMRTAALVVNVGMVLATLCRADRAALSRLCSGLARARFSPTGRKLRP